MTWHNSRRVGQQDQAKGAPQQHPRVSLAPGGHPLQLLDNGGEEVAEPEVLAVVAPD